jgi:hypothetical protein
MRKVLFSIFAVLTIAFCFSPEIKAQAPLLYTGEMGPDTVNSGETLYHYPNGTSFATARRFKDLGDLEVLVKSDSLSGSTNVAYTLQYSYDIDGTLWYDAATLTGNGAAAQYLRSEDTDFGATWWRIKAVGTGTQATKFQTVYAFKRRL